MYYCAMEQQKHVFYSTSGHYIIAKNTIVLLYCTLYIIIYYKIYFLTKYYTYTTYNLQFTYTPSPLHSDLFCKLPIGTSDGLGFQKSVFDDFF